MGGYSVSDNAPAPFEATALAPAPPPHDHLVLLMLECLMIVAVVMVLILFLGSLRKQTSNRVLKLFLFIIKLSTPSFISYCLGLMTKMNVSDWVVWDLFPIWGVLLVAVLGSCGTVSAFKLDDTERGLAALGLMCLHIYFMLSVILYNVDSLKIGIPLAFLELLMLHRVYQRAKSLNFASKNNSNYGVARITRVIQDYMKTEVQNCSQNPSRMHEYPYLVVGRPLTRSEPCRYYCFEAYEAEIVTVEKVWQCEGELLTKRDVDGRIKDTCLSFALFWTLLRRYAGYPLPELSSPELKVEAWKFVRCWLMPDSSSATCEGTFRVIEEELSFLYDYFYTNNFTFYYDNFWWMFSQPIIVAVYIWFAMTYLLNKAKEHTQEHNIYDVATTYGFLVTKIFMCVLLGYESAQIIVFAVITSWFTMECVCIYVRKHNRPRLKYTRRSIEKLCSLAVRLRMKPWKRKLGQYSLLHSHAHVPIHHSILRLLNFQFLSMPELGLKESKSIKVSQAMKAAVVRHFQSSEPWKLTNGKSSLHKYGVLTDFYQACGLETDVQTILVWHIATTYCELAQQNDHTDNDHVTVATSLSRYCAYLVGFAPELLPDPPNISTDMLHGVILHANKIFKGCTTMNTKFETMKAMTNTAEFNTADPILTKGIWLGNSLVNRMMQSNNGPLWQMLEELWVELLLYIAPSDNVAAHIRHLANGSEFITHLWALLTHAGFLSRECTT
ncbi:hypothetical protein RND81_02G210000 [Saponaria officinalis]|uniref:DUF4220 domain-containing protein n=1 Tax=Saponaria officinalis TaxID=3572 RepID=A0AAW1MYK7_SAPOF